MLYTIVTLFIYRSGLPLMGCCITKTGLSSGHLKTQSKISVFFTMLIIFTCLLYCLTGYCDSLPRSVYEQEKLIMNSNEYVIPGTFLDSAVRLSLRQVRHRDRSAYEYTAEVLEFSKPPPAVKNLESHDNDSDSRRRYSVFNAIGSKKFPLAIIIGVKKGGTRALLEFLRIHPDVRALGSEPHFFDRFYDKGLAWYRSLMPRTLEGQITMEKTPSYFVTPEAPQRLFNMSSQTKLIIVVRDPVTRAVSDYTQTRSKSPNLPPFQELAFRNASLGLVDTSWSAIRIGMYAKHLENWLRFFPLSSFLFVSGERLVLDPAGEMGRVQDFLGLRRVVGDKHFFFNETKGFPCLKKSEGSSRPRCLGKSKGRQHPPIPKGALQRLGVFYRPFNLKFYQMTGQDFGWG